MGNSDNLGKLSLKDRLILANQFDLLAILIPDEKEWYTRAGNIVRNGYEREYSSLVQHFDESMNLEKCSYVFDILSMWLAIEEGIEDHKLTVFSGKFMGFDGNNESQELGYARFLVSRPHHWDRFKDRTLNSHMPTHGMYCRMLTAWRAMGKKLTLTPDQVRELTEAQKAPKGS